MCQTPKLASAICALPSQPGPGPGPGPCQESRHSHATALNLFCFSGFLLLEAWTTGFPLASCAWPIMTPTSWALELTFGASRG